VCRKSLGYRINRTRTGISRLAQARSAVRTSDGSLPLPLRYLSAYFEQRRSQYCDHLLVANQSGDFMPWLTFFLRGVRRQARDAEDRTIRRVELMHNMRNALLEE